MKRATLLSKAKTLMIEMVAEMRRRYGKDWIFCVGEEEWTPVKERWEELKINFDTYLQFHGCTVRWDGWKVFIYRKDKYVGKIDIIEINNKV